jgi:hypothetical protein
VRSVGANAVLAVREHAVKQPRITATAIHAIDACSSRPLEPGTTLAMTKATSPRIAAIATTCPATER